MFLRVLVGVDGSQQALEAARQAALVQDVDGALTLVAVWDTAPSSTGGTGTRIPPYFDAELQRSTAEHALRAAREYVAPYTAAATELVRGAPVMQILGEIEHAAGTLVAVGSSGTGRLLGIVKGSVTTELIHRAPCSVLVARPAPDGFPGRIAVGVDGSHESSDAYAAAVYLADRFGASLTTIVARGGHPVDVDAVAATTGGTYEEVPGAPVEALIAVSRCVDLLVLGARGLRGVRALGSVSERVAHGASCSTLLVHEPHEEEPAWTTSPSRQSR